MAKAPRAAHAQAAAEAGPAADAASESGEYTLIATLIGHKDAIASVAFSPDGTRLASACARPPSLSRPSPPAHLVAASDQTVRVWSLETFKEVVTVTGHKGGVSDCAWSPDSLQLATAADDQSVCLWEAATGRLIRRLEGHKDYVVCVNFNPAGTHLVSGAFDGTACLWEVASGKRLQTVRAHTDKMVAAHFNPDGSKFVTAGFDGLVRVWDTASGALLRNFLVATQEIPCCFAKSAPLPPPRSFARWSPNGKYLLVGSYDGSWKLLNAKTGAAARQYVGHQFNDYLIVGAFSLTRGKWIISGSADKTVCVWDINTRELIQRLEGHSDVVVAVSAHPSRDLIASGSLDQRIKIWGWTKKA